MDRPRTKANKRSSLAVFTHWNDKAVAKTTPNPFHRSKIKPVEPPLAKKNLKTEDCREERKRADQTKSRTDPETNAIEEDDGNERLQEIISECHTADRDQR